MNRLVLDAGAFVAIERGDVAMQRRVVAARLANTRLVTHGAIVGQVWRTPKQVKLSLALRGVNVLPIDDGLGRRAGRLLALTRTRDVVDAALVALCEPGDVVVTSDPDDIAVLAEAAKLDIEILHA